MSVKNWLDGSDNWTIAADWSGGTLPGAGDDVVIGQGFPLISAPITAVHSLTIANGSAGLEIENVNSALTTGNLTNAGTMFIDIGSPGDPGSNVSIGGTLSNSGTLNIGGSSNTTPLTTTMTAAALNNTGTINLVTNFFSDNSHAILKIAGAAPATLHGAFSIGADGGTGNGKSARIEFGSGSIKNIAPGASLELNGPQAFVALSSNTASNSALAGLSLNAGSLKLRDASLTTSTNFTNVGELDVTASVASSVALGGKLTNYGTIRIDSFGGQPTMSAPGLSNFGSIVVSGSGAAQAILDITSAPAILTGSVYLGRDETVGVSGPSLVKFASGGISSIGAGAILTLWGAQSFVANSADTSSNSALAGLSRIDGKFFVDSGASVTTTTGLLNLGHLGVGEPNGGSNFAIGGALTNFNAVVIGAIGSPKATTVTATGLSNFGSIDLWGSSASNTGSLTVNGNAANFANIDIRTFSKVTVTGSYGQSAGLTTISGPLKAGSVSLSGGTIDVNDTLTATTVAIAGGLLQGAGNIIGNVNDTGGIVLGGLVNDAYSYRFDFFNPGSPGTLTVNGNFSETNASVVEILRGTASGQFSTINVTGNVQLQGGALQVDVNGGSGFEVAAGETFNIMSFGPGNLSGTFASIQDGPFIGLGNSVNIGGGLTLKAVYNNAAGNIQLRVVTTPSTGDHWTSGASGNYVWSDAANWSTGVPGSSNDAVIDATGSYAIRVTASFTVKSITIANTGSGLGIHSNEPGVVPTPTGTLNVSVTGNLTNAGSLAVDNDGPFAVNGGTTLSVGGTLANGGKLTIGNSHMSSSDVTAAALINTGNVELFGGVWDLGADYVVTGGKATLAIAGPAGFGIPGSVTGHVLLVGDTLLEFGSGQITSIASGASLTLHDSRQHHHTGTVIHSLVAAAGNTTTNSALAGLSYIGGGFGTIFKLVDGPTVTTTGSLTNAGEIDVDYDGPYAVLGGSTLTAGGVLTNVGTVNIGAGGIIRNATLTATGITNNGKINLQGGNLQTNIVEGISEGNDGRATLNITGAAGFGTAGTLTGNVSLSGVALLKFASGQITSIASGSSLTITGNHSFLADASNITANSALAGLSSIGSNFVAGLRLLEGASVTTTGGLANAGGIAVDENGPFVTVGGSSLKIGGTLTNTGGVSLGMSTISAAASLTTGGLTNTGAINLLGGDGQSGHTGHATMTVNGASTNSGDIIVGHNSTLLFNSKIANFHTIRALGGEIDVNGAATGTGSFIIGEGGTLQFGGSNIDLVAFTGGPGTLDLHSPSTFTGAIAGFDTGDRLELAGEVVTALSYGGSVLTANLAGGGTRKFNFAGSFAGLSATDDGSGGTDITAVTSPVTLKAGKDLLLFLSGNDTFVAGTGAFAATDRITGGGGTDTLRLNGDYSGGIVFAPTTLVNVEQIDARVGHSYDLTTSDATVALGQTLTVNGAGLGAGDTLIFNGAAETNGAFVLNGGAGDDSLTGGARNDILKGGLGNDLLNGGAGIDTSIYSDKSTAVVVTLNGSSDATVKVGGVAEDTIRNIENVTGGSANDKLTGDALANTLDGGAGNDTLDGAAGADSFRFDTVLNAATNVDHIVGFLVADDTIQLDNAIFKAVTDTASHVLKASEFFIGAAAHDADDRIIYDSSNGNLLYDADGNGAGAAILFATLPAGLAALSHSDFLIV